jgi:2-dehydro-3-deoxyphosphogluconate aldolase/(4S)-4-hydroxy-2-oxoglutarate aldolase
MTNPMDVYHRIVDIGAMAGMRGNFGPENATRTTAVLFEEGYSVFELTMNSVDPIPAMQAVKAQFGDDAYVGMGTVLDIETAQQVMDAGADFVVSPVLQPEVVRYVQDADVLMIPGIITPTEAMQAWTLGAPLLKVFPVGTLGVDYFKAMFGPLNHIKYMCNGGMNQENARAFIQAGAVAAGMSGWLSGDGTTPAETIRARARSLKANIAQARGETGLPA